MENSAQQSQSLSDVFIARQAIYDINLDVFAYELLFRSGETNQANFIDGDQATSMVIVNAFIEVGLDRLVGNKPAFINLTRGFLTGEHPMPFPKEAVVLEVLEDIEVDDELIAALKKLNDKGYKIALDDFEITEKSINLIPLGHIIKIDIMQSDKEQLQAIVHKLKPFNKILLAEKVETHEEFEFCKSLGFEYFQGYFFCKPKIITSKTLPANQIALLQLLAKSQHPDTEFDELEALVSQDVGVSYKLLRLINSAHFNLPRKVGSLHQALVMLGMHDIKLWVALVTLSNIDNAPRELVKLSLSRAKMCERLAVKLNHKDANNYFTGGMFSLLDALMDRSMESLLEALPFSEDFNKSLLNHEGNLGEILKCVLLYEKGDWENLPSIKLDFPSISEAYLEALDWSEDISTFLKS